MNNRFQVWRIAVRPFSFPASTMPVIFGTVLAVFVGDADFKIGLFILSLAGMVILHAGANLLSDVNDFRRGLDKIPTPVSGAIVRGLVSPRLGLRAAGMLLLTGSLIGIAISVAVGPVIFFLGTAGVLIGALYTATPAALKYHGLGDLAVFLDFGILGALGAWTVQTGAASWVPVLWAVPLSMLVVAIVHANNWRDIQSDRAGNITTVASVLGDRPSLYYYAFLVFGAFAVLIAIMVVTNLAGAKTVMPCTFLVVLAALPKGISLLKKARARHVSKNPMDFIAMDGATAQLNLVFGLLCVAALFLQAACPGLCP